MGFSGLSGSISWMGVNGVIRVEGIDGIAGIAMGEGVELWESQFSSVLASSFHADLLLFLTP
jgi:hypothetical protein